MTTTEGPAEFIEATLDLPIRYIDRSRNCTSHWGTTTRYMGHNRMCRSRR